MFSCNLLSSVDLGKREFIANPTTNDQLAQKFLCRLLGRTRCSFEQQRFEAMRFWRSEFPTLRWPSNTSFIKFLDALIANASSYKPEIVFDSATSLVLDKNSFSVRSHLKVDESSPYTLEYTSASLKAFDSAIFSIQVKIDVDQKTGQGFFAKSTITTTYNSKVYSIDLDKSSVKRYVDQNGYVIIPKM